MAEHRRISRRSAAIGGVGVFWAAPSVLSLNPVAAATGSPPIVVTGEITEASLSAGDDLDSGGDWVSDSTAYLFAENCRILTTAETTDSGDTLPTGTLICAYLVHFAPIATSTQFADATVTFSGPILGYDSTNAGLAGSDVDWGVMSVLYPSSNAARRMESGDQLTFDYANCFVDMRLQARATGIDQMRVYVAA